MRMPLSWFTNFVRRQALFVTVSLIVAAIFWGRGAGHQSVDHPGLFDFTWKPDRFVYGKSLPSLW